MRNSGPGGARGKQLERPARVRPAPADCRFTLGSDGKKQPIHFHLPDYELHDRMPATLPPGAEAVWLDPGIAKEHALSLPEPYPAELMVVHSGEQRPQQRLRVTAA
ncbi:MAG: hypothetical protein ACM3QU_09335 [Verrucomicrobiota bacterium]